MPTPLKASCDAASSGPPVVAPVCITCSWRAESVDNSVARRVGTGKRLPFAILGFAPDGFAARPRAGIHARLAGLRPAIGRCAARLCEVSAALRGELRSPERDGFRARQRAGGVGRHLYSGRARQKEGYPDSAVGLTF